MPPWRGCPAAVRARCGTFSSTLAPQSCDACMRRCVLTGRGCLQGKHVSTPPLNGTILPGVTRASILELAPSLGFTAAEEPISVTDALAADEVFTCGASPPLPPQPTLRNAAMRVGAQTAFAASPSCVLRPGSW